MKLKRDGIPVLILAFGVILPTTTWTILLLPKDISWIGLLVLFGWIILTYLICESEDESENNIFMTGEFECQR